MRDLAEVVEDLSARVSALEAENAALKAASEPESESRSVSRRNALRLGGLGAAVAAGSVLLRPGTAGATTGAMQFGTTNDAGTDATNLTSSSSDATLNSNNTGAGAGVQAHLTDTASQNAALVGLTDSTDQQSAGVVGVATDAASGAAGVLGLSASGGGVVGFTGGPAPAVWGIVGDAAGSAVTGIITDPAGSGTALEAIQHGTGNGIMATIANSANGKRALWATTNGTNQASLITITNSNNNATAARVDTKGGGAGVEASSAKGVGGKFSGKTAQIQLVPSSASTHPSSGSKGQLFVDASGRLWYCFGGTFWKQLA